MLNCYQIQTIFSGLIHYLLTYTIRHNSYDPYIRLVVLKLTDARPRTSRKATRSREVIIQRVLSDLSVSLFFNNLRCLVPGDYLLEALI